MNSTSPTNKDITKSKTHGTISEKTKGKERKREYLTLSLFHHTLLATSSTHVFSMMNDPIIRTQFKILNLSFSIILDFPN